MTSHIRILLILFIAAGAAAAQSNPLEVKPRITEKEVLRLAKSNQTITNKTIPASGLIKAMQWLQQRGKVERDPLIGLSVEDCIVDGAFTLYEGLELFETPQHDVNEVKVLLAQTPVDQLAPEVAKPYKIAEFDKVIVIPFSIEFLSTKFTGHSNFNFMDTVFEEEVTFDTVDFGKGYVRFDSSAFLKESRFDACTFESGVSFSKAAFKEVDFSGSRFMSYATFEATEFKKTSHSRVGPNMTCVSISLPYFGKR